jgi:O-antigen/teichoic acid export membrane protein
LHIAQRITKNFLWLFIGEAAGNGLAFLSTIYLSRMLTDTGFGKLAFAQAVATYLILIVNSGLPTFGIREIAKFSEQVKEFFVNIVTLRLSFAIFVFIIFIVTIWQLRFPSEMKLLLTGTALWVYPQAIYSDFAFQGLEKMQFVAVGRALVQFLFLFSIFFFIKGSDDLTTVPLLRAGSELFTGVALLIIFAILFGKWTLKDIKIAVWKSYLKEAWVIAASLILINIYYTFDTILLGLMDKPEVVGWYNAAYKVMMLFVGIAGLLQMAFAPFFASQKDNQKLFKRGMSGFAVILMSLSALICGTLFLGSHDLIKFLYGNDYLKSIPIIRFLSIALIFIYLGTVFLAPLLFTGFQKYYLLSVLIGAVSNIILNLILIPIWSYKGAAIATISSNFIIAVSGFIFFARGFYFDRHLIKNILIGIAILGLVLFIIYKLQLSSLLAVTLFVLLFSLLFLIQQKSDIAFIFEKFKL